MGIKNDSKYAPMYTFNIKENKYDCIVCKNIGKNYSALKQTTISEHCARKHTGRKIKCDICDKVFDSEASKIQHIVNKHKNGEHSCPFKNCKKNKMKNTSQVQIHYGTIHCAQYWEKTNLL